MPNPILGDANAVTLPSAISISSSTNASPIVLTTGAPHGILSGAPVVVCDHTVNTAANGQWLAGAVTSTTVELLGSVGVGVGGATGTIRDQGPGVEFDIPSDGDDFDASAFNVAYQALADLVWLIFRLVQWRLVIRNGGTFTVASGAAMTTASGSSTHLDGATTFGAASSPTFQDEPVLDNVYSVATPRFSAARFFSRACPVGQPDLDLGPPNYWTKQGAGAGYIAIPAVATAGSQFIAFSASPGVVPAGATLWNCSVAVSYPVGHVGAPATLPTSSLVQVALNTAVRTVLVTVTDTYVSAVVYEATRLITTGTIPGSSLSTVAISATSNATPIQITTSSAHGRATGDIVTISSTTPTTLANGTWKVTVVDATHFTLNGSVGGVAAGAVGSVLPGAVVDHSTYRYDIEFKTETGANALPLTEARGGVIGFYAPGMDEV